MSPNCQVRLVEMGCSLSLDLRAEIMSLMTLITRETLMCHHPRKQRKCLLSHILMWKVEGGQQRSMRHPTNQEEKV